MAAREKGFDRLSVSEMASSFLGVIKSMPSSIRRKWALEGRVFELMVNTIRDPLTAAVNINSLVQELGLSLPPLNQEVATNIIANIMVELFADSNPMNTHKGKGASLGDLAINMVMHLTSFEGE